jgi:predicted RNA-binding protein YlxR (DUF448 family)
MKQRKIPMRMCVGCRTMKPKKELVRLVRDEEGMAHLDLTGKAPGRGAYICKNADCLARAVKIRAFEHAFGAKPDEASLAQLAEQLGQQSDGGGDEPG